MTSPGPVLVVDKLTKMYGQFTALDAVSFSLDRGRILGLIGPNGAGKTTAIKILVGLARPTSGSARIAGVDCANDSKKIKRLVGYMPDSFGSFDNMRVREYLDFFGAAFGIGRRARARRIAEVLETTNATYMQDRYVETLSHGMQQRVGIARTLLHDPQVLIFDEPANGLDPQARIEMRHLLLQLAEMGKTLLVTSHILPELSRICHQVAILTDGKLRAFGTLDEILRTISQDRMIEVQLAVADNLSTAETVVREAVGTGGDVSVSPAEAVVRFRTGMSDAELGALLAKLVRADAGVTQFRELQTNLEDAFLSVTRASESSNGDGGKPKLDAASRLAASLPVGGAR
jgi:ABC-2 type transport system ATP-binding protein